MVTSIIQEFEKQYSGFYVNSILDLGAYWVVNLQKESSNPDDFILDNLYKMDKKSKKISSFTIDENRKTYIKSLKKPVYLKSRVNVTNNELKHYGTPRHSGRYPWGSGKRPKQRLKSKKDNDKFIVSGSKQDAKKLSDDELSKVVKRGNLEEQYSKLFPSKSDKKISNLKNASQTFSNVSRLSDNVSSEFTKAYKTLHESKYKHDNRAEGLSDDELRYLINRVQLEQRYNELTMPPKSKGYDRVMSALNMFGTAASVTATGVSVVAGIKELKRL